MAKETYEVIVDRPDDVSVALMRDYIQEAVRTWGGSYRPPGGYGPDDEGHPLFGGIRNYVRRALSGVRGSKTNVFSAWVIFERGKIYRDWEENPMIFKTKDRAQNEISMAGEANGAKIERVLVTIERIRK